MKASTRSWRHAATRGCLGLFVAWLYLIGGTVAADELGVAVAANFYETLQKMAPLFERASGHTLVLSSGASGQLYAQIKQGAPFDVFLSADTDKPARLDAEALAVPGSRFIYARGTLVLWSPKPGVVDAQGKVLQENGFSHIALASPDTAPYGTAARQVLVSLGLWDGLNQQKKLVLGENVTQTWQFAATGNVDMAFVALSQVKAGAGISGSYWLPPQTMYAPIDQGGVIIARSTKQAAAEAFVKWLRTNPDALAALKGAGYRSGDD